MATPTLAGAVTGPTDKPPDPDLEPPPDPRTTAIACGCFFTVLLLASVVWLMLRGRLELVRTAAIGEHGAAMAAGIGLAVGLTGYVIYARALSRLPSFARMAAQVRQIFRSMGETSTLSLVLFEAVAEEMFFRLAVQDQFGLAGSVAAYTVLTTGAMGWRWLPFAVLHATVLGSLMALGFGLLSTTIANAVMNYLSLRRMLSP